MTDELEPAWCVVCDNYVSRHDDKPNAVIHMRAISGKGCKGPHRVEQTTEPTGSRHRK